MRIINTKKKKCKIIKTDEVLNCTYIRYDKNLWYVVCGQTDKQLLDCTEIEAEYQRLKNEN